MTDDVGRLVLRNNYLQTLALSLSEQRGREDFGFARRLMQTLEAAGPARPHGRVAARRGGADRARAARRGLTRPELAVLLAYAKLALHDALLDSRVPDDPYLGRELVRYFPRMLAERFPDAVETAPAAPRDRRDAARQRHHQPRRLDGRDAPRRPDGGRRAHHRGGLRGGARQLRPDRAERRHRRAGRAACPARSQLRLYGQVQDLLLSRMVWFIRNVDWTAETLDAVVGRFGAGVAAVEAALDTQRCRAGGWRRWAGARQALMEDGVPEPLALRLADAARRSSPRPTS